MSATTQQKVDKGVFTSDASFTIHVVGLCHYDLGNLAFCSWRTLDASNIIPMAINPHILFVIKRPPVTCFMR